MLSGVHPGDTAIVQRNERSEMDFSRGGGRPGTEIGGHILSALQILNIFEII